MISLQKKDVMTNEKRVLKRLEDKLKNENETIVPKMIQSESPPKKKNHVFTASAYI